MSATDGRLTEAELDVIDRIGAAFTAFDALEDYHPSDRDEFIFHVHSIGRIVLGRAAIRAHPERGWMKTKLGSD